MKKLLLLAAVAASFVMGQAVEIESIARKTNANITVPSGQVWRQGIGLNGKFYISDRAGATIHILGLDAVETGTLANVEGANWPSITKDQAGNLIVRADASWPANITPDVPVFRVFPADGGTPVDLEMPASFFETTENGRMDYFGIAEGNVLDDGALYLATQKSTGIFRVVFSGGEVDEDHSMLLPIEGDTFAFGTDCTISAYESADGTTHLIYYLRSLGNAFELALNANEDGFVSTKFTLPNRATAAGSVVGFSIGGEDFYAFALKPGLDASQASSHPDGLAIVRASDLSDVLFTDYGTNRSGYNGGAPGIWLSAEVDGNTATIYEYAGGGSILTYEMKVKEETPQFEDVFILGNVDGAWDPSVGQQMTTEDGILYTATLDVVDMDGYNYFSFTKKLGENSSDWDGIAAYRFGAAESSGDFLINENTINIPIALAPGGQSFKIPVGTYTLKVNLTDMTLVVEGTVGPVDPDPPVVADGVYVFGDVVEGGWDAHKGIKMATEDDIVYTADIEVADSWEGDGWFGLTKALCPEGHSDPWTAIAPYRFGPVSEGDFLVTDELLGTEISLTDEAFPSFQVPAGSYKIVVNMSTMKAVITKAGEPGIKGDVNGDGEVTVGDVSAIYDIMLGLSENYKDRADVNGDGEITVGDVSAVYDIMLGIE